MPHAAEPNGHVRKRLIAWRARASGLFGPRSISAVGVLAAGVVLAEVNLLGAQHFSRFDVTSQGLFTLSPATRTLLAAQNEPIEIVSLLTRSDPHAVDADHLLDAYRAESELVQVRHVDPDRDVAAFLALGQKYDIAAEERPSGVVVADASFVVRRGEKTWFIRSDQLASQDAEGHVHSLLEAKLSEAIARVSERERARVCFVTGHGERSIEDAGPDGLAELGRRLGQSNLEPVRVPLDVPEPTDELDDCRVVAVIAPERPFSQAHAQLLETALSHANLLLLLDPLVDADARLGDAGLGGLSGLLGVGLRPGFVIEHDAERRLPRGIGESFFANVVTHPISRGLSTSEARLDARPVVVAAQPLLLSTGSFAVPLLQSSAGATLLDDLSRVERANGGTAETFVLAAAVELPDYRSTAGPGESKHARAVIAGSSNMASSNSFRNPQLYGNRLFVENALSWLAERPSTISVPERVSGSAPLALSEQSLTDLLLYVVLYMPATAALLGVFVVLRRRSLAARSRREATS